MTIETETYDGAPGGSNLAVLPHEIPDTQARYIQDGFVDKPGLAYRRGIVGPVPSVATFTTDAEGIVQVYRPDLGHRVAVLRTAAGPIMVLSVMASPYSSATDVNWLNPGDFKSGAVYDIVDAKPSLGGGVTIGTSKQLTDNPFGTSYWQTFGFWRGAAKADYTTGTMSVAGTAVTGTGTTWVGNIEPGMYLLGIVDGGTGYGLIGVVKTVVSNTSLTLLENSAYGTVGAPPIGSGPVVYKLTSVRGFGAQYSSGRLTVTAGATSVTGAGTKFLSNTAGSDLTPAGSGSWFVFRASDGLFVGTISSIQSETGFTLAAGAVVTLDNEHFVASRAYPLTQWSVDSSVGTKVGFLSAVYKERQWYANLGLAPELTYRLWFSEVSKPESIDVDHVEGNFIDVGSTKGLNKPISALATADNALIVLKENEAFALSGDTPEQFTLNRLDIDDGTISPMSVQQVDGGVVWAGKRGIYFFDGRSVNSIVEASLDGWYKDLVKTIDTSTSRVWSLVAKNHYMLFIEAVTPTYVPIKGNTSATSYGGGVYGGGVYGVGVTRMTISVYLPTGAVTFLTNADIRGAIEMPTVTGYNTWYIVNTASGARICTTNDLFDTTGVDTITCTGNTAGPDFYLESKRYSLGDALRKKLFKELLLTYLATGDTLKLDTIVGLNDAGITSLTTWAITSTFNTARIKFLKRTQLFGFRVYQNSASVTSVKLGPWSLGFKLQRKGRV